MIKNIDNVDDITGFCFAESDSECLVHVETAVYRQISITDSSKSRIVFICVEDIPRLIKCLELANKEFGENNV